MRKFIIGTLLFVIFSHEIKAQHHTESKQENDHPVEHSHMHKNHIALFPGGTHSLNHPIMHFTVGIDYERRLAWLDNKLGIGILGEAIFADHLEVLTGIPVSYHPVSSLKLILAPLIEFHKATHESHDDHTHADSYTSEFGYRMGLAYSFHFGNWALAPSVNMDFIGKDSHASMVFGVGIGYGF